MGERRDRGDEEGGGGRKAPGLPTGGPRIIITTLSEGNPRMRPGWPGPRARIEIRPYVRRISCMSCPNWERRR